MTWPKYQSVAYGTWSEERDNTARSLYVADVDKDGKKEILLGGTSRSYVLGKSAPPELRGRLVNGGELRIIQLRGSTLHLETRVSWPGIGWAEVNAVYADDIDGDGNTEIIAAGSTTKADIDASGITRYTIKAQALVYNWDGTSLTLRANHIWKLGPYPNAEVNAVCAADIDGDGKKEILVAGSAWDIGREERAFFEVYNGGPTPFSTRKATQVWPSGRGHNEVKGIAVKDIDGDKKVEIVTAAALRDKYWVNDGIVEGKGEIIAWSPQPSDKGLKFLEKARREWKGSNAHVTEPRSLWVGDVDDEKGIEIVTGGTHRHGLYTNADWYSADIKIWRMAGTTFNEVNGVNLILRSPSDHYWLTSCNSVYAADFDSDNLKELLLTGEVGLKERPILGYLGAMNPRKNFWTVPDHELFERFSTYIFHRGTTDLDTHTWGIAAADLDGDNRIETVVAGYFGWYNRGVFVCVFR
jgi:hypothetical protein